MGSSFLSQRTHSWNGISWLLIVFLPDAVTDSTTLHLVALWRRHDGNLIARLLLLPSYSPLCRVSPTSQEPQPWYSSSQIKHFLGCFWLQRSQPTLTSVFCNRQQWQFFCRSFLSVAKVLHLAKSPCVHIQNNSKMFLNKKVIYTIYIKVKLCEKFNWHTRFWLCLSKE